MLHLMFNNSLSHVKVTILLAICILLIWAKIILTWVNSPHVSLEMHIVTVRFHAANMSMLI